MKRIYVKLLAFSIAFVAAIAVLYYSDNKDFYNEGQNGCYTIAVGETFTFKLRNPGSAMAQIWLKPDQGLEMVGNTFQPDLFEQGCDGCSGTGIYTFKGKKAGSYKILMGLCQPGATPCAEQNIQPDNVFTVTVTP